jgi:hypothetical protein
MAAVDPYAQRAQPEDVHCLLGSGPIKREIIYSTPLSGFFVGHFEDDNSNGRIFLNVFVNNGLRHYLNSGSVPPFAAFADRTIAAVRCLIPPSSSHDPLPEIV